MTDKIKANLIGLEVGGFESEEDSQAFDEFKNSLYSMTKGIVIIPNYNEDTGELMSFTVDSKKAHNIVERIEDSDLEKRARDALREGLVNDVDVKELLDKINKIYE